MRAQPQHQQSYGYVMSSMPASLAPSARNSPPLYPQQAPQFISIPSLDGNIMYGQYPQSSMFGFQQALPQFAPHPIGYGWLPQQQQVLFQANPHVQIPLQQQRMQVPMSFDNSIPHGLQGYAPLQPYQQTGSSGYLPQGHQYLVPRSGVATPYAEPRTPYNEPRSPAELSNWGERQVRPSYLFLA